VTFGVAGRYGLLAFGALRYLPDLSAAAVALVLIVALTVFAPWVLPHPLDGTTATHPTEALLPPTGSHWMGTDAVGRDVLSRVVFGARLVAHGAQRVDLGQGDASWVVLADPEGNEFCVLGQRRE